MKILITGGGSEEPIDTVRYITNFSTGKTSCFLAEKFAEAGDDVTLLTAEKAVHPAKTAPNLKTVFYRTFKDLAFNLKKLCAAQSFDTVIHAAAVSDYSVSSIIVDGKEFLPEQIAKVPSGLELTVNMKKNPKLVDSIKSWSKESGKIPVLVAFKLTSKATPEERKAAVEKVFSSNQNSLLAPDYVVSNDLSEITKDEHPCRIFSKDLDTAALADNLNGLYKELERLTTQGQDKNYLK